MQLHHCCLCRSNPTQLFVHEPMRMHTGSDAACAGPNTCMCSYTFLCRHMRRCDPEVCAGAQACALSSPSVQSCEIPQMLWASDQEKLARGARSCSEDPGGRRLAGLQHILPLAPFPPPSQNNAHHHAYTKTFTPFSPPHKHTSTSTPEVQARPNNSLTHPTRSPT